MIVLLVWVGCSESASTVSMSESVSKSDLAEIREIVADRISEKMEKTKSNKGAVTRFTTSADSIKKKLRIVRISKEDNVYYITGKVPNVEVVVLKSIAFSDNRYKHNKGDTIKMVIFFKCLVKETGFGEKKYLREKLVTFPDYMLKLPEIKAKLKQSKFM